MAQKKKSNAPAVPEPAAAIAPSPTARRFVRQLPVSLPSGERDRATERLIELIDRRKAYMRQKNDENNAWRDRIKKCDGEIEGQAELLRDGMARMDVECEERPDFRTNSVTVVRLDTGEIVETRAMSVTERQLELGTGDDEDDEDLIDDEPEEER